MWMSDEKYTYVQDCKEKKSIARSARHARTHCGKGGSVKLPSDFKTRKELNAMNGECKSYRMNDPMTWAEFKELPDDLKVQYINKLRERFNVPDREIAKVFDVGFNTIYRWFKTLGLCKGMGSGNKVIKWDEAGWNAWLNGETNETTVENPSEEPCEPVEEEIVDIPEAENCPEETCTYAAECPEKMIRDAGPIAFAGNSVPVIPKSGSMTFEGNDVDDILKSIKTMLSGVRVNLTVSWEVVG